MTRPSEQLPHPPTGTDRPARRLSRRTLLGGLAAGSALTVAGCSASSGAPGNKKHVEVYVWTNGPAIDANFRTRVQMFNKHFAGKYSAHINFLPYDQFWQKVDLQYAAHKPFDMYYWDVQAYAQYKRGLLQDEESVVGKSGITDPAKYRTQLYDPWRFDGKNLYVIPDNVQSMALFYNRDHFDDARLSYPDPTWTYDRVIETARKLKKTSGAKVTRWGFDVGDLGGTWWGIQTLSWAAGTAFVDRPLEPRKFRFTEPANVAALKFIQDLMWDEHIAPRPDERAAIGQQNGGFQSGTYAMTPVGTWNIATYKQMKGNWAMTSLPLYQGKSIAPYWLGGWVIPKNSPALSAAQAFATWSATTFQEQMAKDHDWIPLQNAARESAAMLKGMPRGFADAMKKLPEARIGDIYTQNMQKIFSEPFANSIEQLLARKVTPHAAAKQMQDGATELLA